VIQEISFQSTKILSLFLPKLGILAKIPGEACRYLGYSLQFAGPRAEVSKLLIFGSRLFQPPKTEAFAETNGIAMSKSWKTGTVL
jgi:hypothetical protein